MTTAFLMIGVLLQTMPTTIAEIVTAITETLGGFIPLTTISLFVFFGFVVSAGIFLVRRVIKVGR